MNTTASATVRALEDERDAMRDLANDYRDRWIRQVQANDSARAVIAARGLELGELRDRIRRAVAELDAAPDADPEKPSKRAMREVLQANTRAWAVLTEGRDPPSKRRAEDAPDRQSKGFRGGCALGKGPIPGAGPAGDTPPDVGDGP